MTSVPICKRNEYLEEVEIPSSVNVIPNGAFSDCKYLASIDLPNVTEIGDGAFSDCTSLTSIVLPNAERIESGAFDGCKKLKYIMVDRNKISQKSLDIHNKCNVVAIDINTKEVLTSAKQDIKEGVNMGNKKQDPYKQQRRDWGNVKPATREHNDKTKYDRKEKYKKDLRDLDENRHHHVRKRRIYTEEAEEKIPFTEFLDHCVAMGGNWTGMLLYGIRDMFPDYYEKMPDKKYSYKEVCDILVNDLNIDPNS